MATKTKTVSKRFPADTTLEELTFLNDKKLDAELYAYLQMNSYPAGGETVVFKRDLKTQKEICEDLKYKQGVTMSVKTYRRHLQYLIERGYVIDIEDRYILPQKENIYHLLPLDTIKFIQWTLKKPVIKMYIYLGQRWKYKKNYLFTKEELAEHVGLSIKHHSEMYEYVDACLSALYCCGLIDFEPVVVKKVPRLKLTNWSEEPRRKNS